MCMLNLIARASCLPVALSSELPALCQTDAMLCHRYSGCCAVSAPKHLSEGGRGVSQPFLGKPMDLLQAGEDCVHLTQAPLISALAPFSSSSHLLASPMLFGDDGNIGRVPPAKKCKARRCANVSIS